MCLWNLNSHNCLPPTSLLSHLSHPWKMKGHGRHPAWKQAIWGRGGLVNLPITHHSHITHMQQLQTDVPISRRENDCAMCRSASWKLSEQCEHLPNKAYAAQVPGTLKSLWPEHSQAAAKNEKLLWRVNFKMTFLRGTFLMQCYHPWAKCLRNLKKILKSFYFFETIPSMKRNLPTAEESKEIRDFNMREISEGWVYP